MGAGHDVVSSVRAIAAPALERHGLELVDVEYRREPAGWTLRLFIDKPGGTTLADCQRMSEEIGTLLEVEDAIRHRFTLEVSSPGLDRPLTKERDFVAAQGKRVRLTMKEAIAGRRHFTGRLAWCGEPPSARERGRPGMALGLIDDTGMEHEIPLESIDRARLVYEWPETVRPGGRNRHGSGKTGRKG